MDVVQLKSKLECPEKVRSRETRKNPSVKGHIPNVKGKIATAKGKFESLKVKFGKYKGKRETLLCLRARRGTHGNKILRSIWFIWEKSNPKSTNKRRGEIGIHKDGQRNQKRKEALYDWIQLEKRIVNDSVQFTID